MKKFLCLFVLLILFGCHARPEKELYALAVEDAKEAGSEEIVPLVCLTPENGDVYFAEGQAVFLTWHKHPEIYKEGEIFTSSPKAIWVVSLKEFEKKAPSPDLHSRSCQLMGLPISNGYTHFSVISADPSSVKRPAYQTDVYLDRMEIEFDTSVDEEFKVWFEGQMEASYAGSKYPWTRLGYTYDWANPESPYGLTEFIIPKGTQVKVHKTYANDEFFDYLAR